MGVAFKFTWLSKGTNDFDTFLKHLFIFLRICFKMFIITIISQIISTNTILMITILSFYGLQCLIGEIYQRSCVHIQFPVSSMHIQFTMFLVYKNSHVQMTTTLCAFCVDAVIIIAQCYFRDGQQTRKFKICKGNQPFITNTNILDANPKSSKRVLMFLIRHQVATFFSKDPLQSRKNNSTLDKCLTLRSLTDTFHDIT